MVLHFDGGYRTATECKFLEQVEEELAKFQTTCKHNSVLVFPPLGARYRYFIHQLVGLRPRLQTVSISQGRQRRTVVFFDSGRVIPEMEQSPFDTQRTFFGRGRGRRTRRPDQALYVPGALRQAKREWQEQNLSTESPINRGGNMNLSTNNTRAAAEGVESAISRFTANDGTDCNNIDNRSGQNCETQTVESLQDSKPVSKKIGDVPEGTGSISSDAHEQHVNAKSHFTSVQRLVNEKKEVNGKNMIEKDGDQTALKELKNELVVRKANSTMVLVEETPINASHVRDERQERDISTVKTESNASNKQILEAESSNNEIKHAVDDHRIGNLQACTCVVSYDREAEKTLTAVHENCGASNDKPLNELDKSVTEQNHETNRKTNLIKELNLKQDGPSLEGYKDLMVDEKKLDDGEESKLTGDIMVKADHSSEISVVYNSDFDGREKVGHGENCTESKLVQVHCAKSEGSEPLAMLSSDAFDHKGEHAKNKAITHENSMQTAFSHGEMTSECRDFNSGPEGLLSQTGKLLAKFDDLKTCGDDCSNQHKAANGHNLGLIENVVKHCEENTSVSDLTAGQSKTDKEEAMKEAGLKSPQMSADKNITNFMNDHEVISDILDSTCSNDDRKLELQINDYRSVLVVNSDKRAKESEVPLEIMAEKNQAVSDKTERGSNSAFLEGNQNGDELETELQKTSKKKKSKKDRSKDQKDDKTKCKEKGEKKKKKEKKSGKTEKSDNEQELDLEGKTKEGRKSKTKVLSTKEQKEKDLNTGVKGSDSRNGDGDDGGDSDDWESIFDESGDCLNPEHSEELSRLTGIENPEIHKTQFDYYSFTPREVELDDEEFGHIVEIYNFSSELKTQDLMQALSSFRSKGFDIKWVDDTHALGIFSSHITAQEAIRFCSSPLMKLRPVSRGTPESRRKATNCFEFLQPYKERPKTSKLLADRLVTGALGVRSKMTREERVKEREKLKEAKDKKQQEKIQKAQIWGD